MTIINSSAAFDVEVFEGRVHECHVRVYQDPDGGYSALVATLPGVVSEGETVEEAIANVREAAEGVLQEYVESGQKIPWCEATADSDTNNLTCEKRILVNV